MTISQMKIISAADNHLVIYGLDILDATRKIETKKKISFKVVTNYLRAHLLPIKKVKYKT